MFIKHRASSFSDFLKKKIKLQLKKVLLPILSKMAKLLNQNQNQISEHILINLSHQSLKRLYIDSEPIDIVFIFQAASFWPSWESFWNACIEDKRFNPIMLLSDDVFTEKMQFKTAKDFLNKKKISYQHVSDVNLSDINPHIVVLHTPYDGHRPKYLYAKMLSSRGYRVVYITYGIEISNTDKAKKDHFEGGVTTNAWRVYTFSQRMIVEYKLHSPTGGDMVRSFGHPKFDYLNKIHFPSLPEEIISRVKGRKTVLWKVHFPKEINGEVITPSLQLYDNFLNILETYSKELFFIFMPHPKFYEQLDKLRDAKKFKKKINSISNLYESTDDDYRQVLMNCDYYIVDRSAIMVESAITNRPILYIRAKNPESMTKPIQKLIDSYYQATNINDIKYFLDKVVLLNKDDSKSKRIKAFHSIIPTIDGKSGYKIKKDILQSLIEENIIKNRV